jgi:hypothetical protein
LIPCYKFADLVDLFSRKTLATFESDRVEPEFHFTVIAFDMNVRRFGSITA